MHRADPSSRHPSPHRRDRRYPPPGGGPVSELLEPPGPAPLQPHRARVTIAPLPQRRQLFGGYRPSLIGVVAIVLWLVIAACILWPH